MAADETREAVVQKALETVCPGPWTVIHLVGLEWVIDDAFCGTVQPNCDAPAINSWLQSMSAQDRDELIARLNKNLERAPSGVSH